VQRDVWLRSLGLNFPVPILSIRRVHFEFAAWLHLSVIVVVVPIVELKLPIGLQFSVIILVIAVVQFNISIIFDLAIIVIAPWILEFKLSGHNICLLFDLNRASANYPQAQLSSHSAHRLSSLIA
jgi:hypothetical protein